MNKKQQTNLGIISGLIFIIAYIILSLFFNCPTENQYIALRILISLGAAAFAIVIPGLLEVKYKNMITATGAIAVFFIVYTFNPQPINSLSDCPKNDTYLTGSVYYGNHPFEYARVSFPELNTPEYITNTNGRFEIRSPLSFNSDKLLVNVKTADRTIDTLLSIDYTDNFKINIPKKQLSLVNQNDTNEFCIECIAKDSIGVIKNFKNKCEKDSLYLVNYIAGFTRASKEQSRAVECKWKKSNDR